MNNEITERLASSNLKLGIVAGGQLGKMLIQEASKWDIETYILDKDENCPAGKIASHYIQGSHLEFEDVYQFGKQVDLLTFEIESINVDALRKLKSEGIKILPDPEILALIQDKGLQKDFYTENDIPTAPFTKYEDENAIIDAIENGTLKYPFVQKLRKGGYDGRGVSVIKSKDDLAELLKGKSIIEEKVEIEKEISVIVARNSTGEIKSFPVVEMIFDPKANLVDRLVCPSSVSEEQAIKATEIADKIIESLQMVGLLAIEFFVDSNGAVIVNEMAPRTHNSGHHTIESIVTSQFEQHLRSVLNLPLGSTRLKLPAVMLNILGEPGHEGPTRYVGLEECMAIEGVKIHLYGKKVTRPYRKMGHVTILSSSLEGALAKADQVKNRLSVIT